MPIHVILVDGFAAILIVVGFSFVFLQKPLRRAIRRPSANGEEDPAHYAMIISGMMMLAFGIIIAAFTTLYYIYAQG